MMITAVYDEQYRIACCDTTIKLIEQSKYEDRIPSRLGHFQLFFSTCIDEPVSLIRRIKKIATDILIILKLPFSDNRHSKSVILKYKVICILLLNPLDIITSLLTSSIRISSTALGILSPSLALTGWLKAELIEKKIAEIYKNVWMYFIIKSTINHKTAVTLKPEQIFNPNLLMTPAPCRQLSRSEALQATPSNTIPKTCASNPANVTKGMKENQNLDIKANLTEVIPYRALKYLGSDLCLNLISIVKKYPVKKNGKSENDILKKNIDLKFEESLSYLRSANKTKFDIFFTKTYDKKIQYQPNHILKLLTKILPLNNRDAIKAATTNLNREELKIFHDYIHKNVFLNNGKQFFCSESTDFLDQYNLNGFRLLSNNFKDEYDSSYKFGRLNVYIL